MVSIISKTGGDCKGKAELTDGLSDQPQHLPDKLCGQAGRPGTVLLKAPRTVVVPGIRDRPESEKGRTRFTQHTWATAAVSISALSGAQEAASRSRPSPSTKCSPVTTLPKNTLRPSSRCPAALPFRQNCFFHCTAEFRISQVPGRGKRRFSGRIFIKRAFSPGKNVVSYEAENQNFRRRRNSL
jgi:hypothetical protein